MKNKLIVFLIAAVALMVLPLIAQSAGNFWASPACSPCTPTCSRC